MQKRMKNSDYYDIQWYSMTHHMTMVKIYNTKFLCWNQFFIQISKNYVATKLCISEYTEEHFFWENVWNTKTKTAKDNNNIQFWWSWLLSYSVWFFVLNDVTVTSFDRRNNKF